MKKILTAFLIGAFVFGVGTADIQSVNAASLEKVKETKEKYDKAKDKFDKVTDGDKNTRQKPPEPPKDANGNPIAPPDRNSDDSNRPEPPKDANGNPIAPPDRNSDDSSRPEPPKDENGNPMPPPDKNNGETNSKDKFDDMKDRYDTAKGIFKK